MNQVTGSSHGAGAGNYKNLNFKKTTSKSKLHAIQQHGTKNKDGVVTVELNEELVGGTAEKRNWRGIIISLLVILLIASLIIVAIIITNPEFSVFERFTFDDIFDPKYQPRYYDAVWLSEDEYILQNSTRNIMSMDLSTNESTLLILNRTVDDEGIVRFWVKPDKEYILVTTDEEKFYRSSYEAVYRIYDVATKTLLPNALTPPGVTGPVRLQYAAWAPQGGGLVFVYKNNVYYQSGVLNDPQPVTSNGVEGEIFNGVPDWVYKEEVLGTNSPIYWNAEGTYLVFASFNDSQVKKAWYPIYDNKDYSEVKYIPYPKAGYTNPTVALYAMSIEDTSTLVQIDIPEQFQDQDHYFTGLVWKDRYQVAVTWLNRAQNVSVLVFCQVDSGRCDVNYEQQTPNGWIVQRGDIIFAKDSQSYFTILPMKEGARGSYMHIARVTAEGGRIGEVTFLTQGFWEVTKIVGYNPDKNLLFFLSTEHGTINRTLYSVNISTHERTCMTCDMFPDCSYFSADFNAEGTRYFLQCMGPHVPSTTLHSIEVSNYTTVESNQDITDNFKDKDYVVDEFAKTKTSDGVYDIQVKLLMPRNLDEHRKYPLLIDVYGGPESQMVDTKFHQGWYSYLSSNYHVIIALVDGRGSGNRGTKFMYEVYRRLGTVEVEDQVTAVKWLLDEYPFLDWNKTAIWGWSYGGFASTLAATYGIFNCTMAVAPVTDFRYYDSIYTERYMGQPKPADNLQGYKNTNISAQASSLHGTKYLLVHGLADDNVHFQNSANLVRALVQEGITHQVQYYTDENHALADHMVQRNLYQTMTDFLLRCYDL